MLIPFRSVVEICGGVESILHVGAHEGEEAEDYAACGVKDVFWVEANRNKMWLLRRHCEGLHPTMRSRFLCAAFSDGSREGTLHITNNGQSSSLLPLGTHATHHPHVHVVEDRRVCLERGDDCLRGERFDLVALDVQGAELAVLRGLPTILSTAKAVYAEVNTEHVYEGCPLVGELDEHLKDFHRVVTSMTPHGWGDALWLRNQP